MAETFVYQNHYNFCGKCNDERDLTMAIPSISYGTYGPLECLNCVLQKFSDELDQYRDNENLMESIKPELSRTKKTAMKLFKLDDPDVLKRKIEELENLLSGQNEPLSTNLEDQEQNA